MKKRDMNYELLRIIAMLMIIMLHYLNFGQAIENVEPYTFNFIIVFISKIFCSISVNIYFFITGYYMIKSKVKIKNIIRIWLETFFYSVVILIILYKWNNYTISDIIKAIMPFSSGEYWFITAYMALYIFIPFINKFLYAITQKQYKKFLIISGIIFCIVSYIFPDNTIKINRGCSLIWAIYLYIIAGYIRLYYNKEKIKNKHLLFIIVLCFAITFIEILFSYIIFNKFIDRICHYNAIPIFAISICVFLLFNKVKIEKEFLITIISKISSCTLGIYLIHMNKYLSTYIWLKFNSATIVNEKYFILHYIGTVSLIFISCCIIDYIRQIIFKLISKINVIQKLNSKVEKINFILEDEYEWRHIWKD